MEHGDVHEELLPLDASEQFVTINKGKLANDQCSERFMREVHLQILKVKEQPNYFDSGITKTKSGNLEYQSNTHEILLDL